MLTKNVAFNEHDNFKRKRGQNFPGCRASPRDTWAVEAALHPAEHHSVHNDSTACGMASAGSGTSAPLHRFGHTHAPALSGDQGLCAPRFHGTEHV